MALSRDRRTPPLVRALRARRRAAARPLRRLALAFASLLLSAVTVLPWMIPQSAALPPSAAGWGTAIWRRSGSTSPIYREWNGSSFDSAQSAGSLGEWRVMQGAASTTRDEVIVAGVRADGWISGGRWDGSSWSAFGFVMSQVAETYWWSVDVAYEAASGDALLVWANGTTGTSPLSYRVWNGSTWSGAATITAPLSGAARQLQLAAAPDSDEMVLVVSNDSSQDYALVWSGSAWGNAVTLEASGAGDDRTDAAVTYLKQSGDAVVAYGKDSPTLYYRTWDGASWSAESAVTPPGGVSGNVRWSFMASRPATNALVLGVLTAANEVWLDVFDGSTWQVGTMATAAAAGTTFPGVAVAFEGSSGEALAVYSEADNHPRYRTWSSGSGWSSEYDVADVHAHPNSVTLETRPGSDEVMLAVQDDLSDLHYVLWDGSSWGAETEVETDTGETGVQPFVFIWDQAPPTLSGTVYLDRNGDGSLADAVGVAGVSVYLYQDNSPQNVPGTEDTVFRSTTTGAGGTYSFGDVPDGHYWVVVDSKTIGGSYTAGHGLTDVWAEQTYAPEGGVRFDGSVWWFLEDPGPLFGGMRATTSDAATSLATREHIARMEIVGGAPAPGLSFTGIDFGFSFNVVTNTAGGDTRDDDAFAHRTVQGSLRQFIANASALSGANAMRFVPAVAVNAPAWWRVVVSNPLPSISDAGTTIDGTAYSPTDGVTLLDTNPGFLGANAGGGLTVGVDGVSLPQVAAPELEIKGTTTADGLDLEAANSAVRHLAIVGFGDPAVDWTDSAIRVGAQGGATIEGNVIGSGAGAFADPGPGNRTAAAGVHFEASIGAPSTVSGNLIGFTDEGVFASGSTGVTVTGNEVRGVGTTGNTVVDSISFEIGSTGCVATGNLVDGSPANGIGTFRGAGGFTVGNNTVRNAGLAGEETAGISVFGTGSTIEANVVEGSAGPAIVVEGRHNGTDSWPAALHNRISRNQTSGNGGLGIDLVEASDDLAPHDQGDGVTLTPGSNATTGNEGLDAPVVTSADTSAVAGTACPGCEVEVFVAAAGAGDGYAGSDYGEGSEYLGTAFADGSGAWSLPVGSLSDAEAVSAVAIDGSGNTSEFAANLEVSGAPVFDQDLGDRTDAEGDAISISAAATDPDGDPLTYSATGLPPRVFIDPGTGVISGTLAYRAAADSPYSVTVQVEDPGGLIDTDAFTWTVTDTPVPLAITKVSDAAGLVSPGETIGYSLLVEVPGSVHQTGITVTDAVPAGTSYVPGSLVVEAPAVARDQFDPIAYDGQDGALLWSGPWVEIDGGPINAAPDEVVNSSWCPTSPCFRLGGNGVSLLDEGIDRPVDLSGRSTATLEFDMRRQLLGSAGGSALIQVRVGGGAWATVATFALNTSDPAPVHQSYDISAYIGSDTTVRIAGSGTVYSYFFADDVEVVADGVVVATGGSPPTLASGYHLEPGESLTARFSVVVGDPPTVAAVDNTATVATDQEPGGQIDSTHDVVDTPPAFDQDLGNRSDAEGAVISLPSPATDPDWGPLQYSATGLPPGLSMNPSTGSISGTISYDASPGSPYSVVLRVEDSLHLFDTDTFTWTVTNTNRPPIVTNPGSQANAEGDGVYLALQGSDPDGDTLAWSASNLPPGLDIDPATGVISGTISYDAAPGSPYSSTYQATDNGIPNLSASGVFQWTVTETNRPPTFDGDVVDRSDAEGVTVSLPTPATDLDGDTLAWSATGLPPGLDIDPATGLISGIISYDASPGSPYAVVVRVEDPGHLFDTDSFTWTVPDTNRRPTFDGDLGDRSDAEGDSVSLAAPATDPDGDTLTWSATGLPPDLVIDPATGVISGTISYDASPGSPYSVVVRVEDPGHLFDTDSFTWTVTDTNRAPVVTDPGPQGSAEGQAVNLAVLGWDPDGDTLTWSASGLPPDLVIDPATGVISGTISYDAAPGSPYSVVVRTTDDGTPQRWDEVSFAWTVTDTNRPPVVTDPGGQADAEGDPVSLAMSGFDPDGDSVTWSATGLPPDLVIDPATGVISGTISYDASPGSPYGVTVTATDDGSPVLSTGVSFVWTVANTNRPPQVLHPGDHWAAEGDAISFGVAGSDPDGDGLTWSATGLPPDLVIDPGTGVISGTLSYEAAAGSPHSVTVTASDDGTPNLADSTTFNFTVANTNRAPVVTDPGGQSSAEGDPVLLPMAGSDPDGDTVTWSATGLPPDLVIDPATGVISGTLSYEAAAGSPHSVTVTATDDGTPNLADSTTFNFTVANTNRAPVVTDPGDQSSAEGDPVLLPMAGSDPDGDTVTWSATGLPPDLVIDPATGVISGTLSYEAAAGSPHTVAVTATDDGSPVLSSGVAFTWTVADTNRAPVVVAPADQPNAEGDTVSLVVSGWDPDGDSVTWSAVGLPPDLVIDPVTGVISGSLSYDAAGLYPVTVTATDDGTPSLSTDAASAWEVANTNRAPLVTDPGDQSNAEGDTVSLAMQGSDPDGDALTWSAVGLPPDLVIDPAGGVISGTLDFESAGAYPVTVTATDDGTPSLSTDTAFTWEVANTNRAPVVIEPDDRTDPEGSLVSLPVEGSDPDGNALTWSATGLPPGLVIDPASGVISGTISYAASPDSPYEVIVAAGDDGTPSLVSSAAFSWSVGEVDRPPALEAPPDRRGQVGDPASFAPGASDPDGDSLAWTAWGLPPGVAIDGHTGRISGTLGRAGTFTVTVMVTSGGLSDTDSFIWTVEAAGAPYFEPIPNRTGVVGDRAALTVAAGHPDGALLTFSATGLPPGLTLDADTGAISGTFITAGNFSVTITAEDPAGALASATFLWVVAARPDLPPEARNDTVTVERDQLGNGAVVIDVLGNDRDPEGAVLHLVEVGNPGVGTVRTVGGSVVFTPPAGWEGTVTFIYRVADPAGHQAQATVTITVEPTLAERIGASSLRWQSADAAGVAVSAYGGRGGALLNALVQSLHVLRVPLALFGGAVIWSLLLGGALNVGLALRRGLPLSLLRRGRLMAIVLAAQGAKVPAYRRAGGEEVVWQYLATDARIKATGRHAEAGGRGWSEVRTDEGPAWVESMHLTEHVDRAFFAEDPVPQQLLERLVGALRRREPLGHLISRQGLWVAHHAPPVHYPVERVASLWTDTEQRVWKGRNPAYPDLTGSFDTAVAAGVLDAFDDPRMELAADQCAVPSTVIPVEFANFHYISIGADLLGPERLDQTAWLVHFAYENGRPRVVGLCREG